ncbi:zinc ribbon domain-containing protein [Lacticaseibacillus parakribbianus]|uniref:zinc ribbon domain-containing protein n=1 Tax=Lacticaseibacillus parakribbianus TaxID=2970927 RepID=UPI0021CAF605|nr:zinc ribbon domain-containing protein [Lacticaseibacillus parakribbianus]
MTVPKFCANCGAPLTPGAKFCTRCGAKVAPVAETPAEAAGRDAPRGAAQAAPVAPVAPASPAAQAAPDATAAAATAAPTEPADAAEAPVTAAETAAENATGPASEAPASEATATETSASATASASATQPAAAAQPTAPVTATPASASATQPAAAPAWWVKLCAVAQDPRVGAVLTVLIGLGWFIGGNALHRVVTGVNTLLNTIAFDAGVNTESLGLSGVTNGIGALGTLMMLIAIVVAAVGVLVWFRPQSRAKAMLGLITTDLGAAAVGILLYVGIKFQLSHTMLPNTSYSVGQLLKTAQTSTDWLNNSALGSLSKYTDMLRGLIGNITLAQTMLLVVAVAGAVVGGLLLYVRGKHD